MGSLFRYVPLDLVRGLAAVEIISLADQLCVELFCFGETATDVDQILAYIGY
jgi:hypothetical protein